MGVFLAIAGLVLYPRPQGISGTAILVLGTLILCVSSLVCAGVGSPSRLAIAFVALAATSSLWSEVPTTTLFQAVGLAIPLFAAGLVANYVSFETFLQVADRTLKTLVSLSLVTAVLWPNVGVTQRVVNHGAWRGIYEHRNGFAYVVVIAIITHVAARMSRPGFATWALWSFIFMFALKMAGSSGALILVAVSGLLYASVRQFALEAPDVRRQQLLAAIHFGAVVVLAVVVFRGPLVAFIGRDLTFTGRTDIWAGASAALRDRWVLGYGWGSILGEGDSAALIIRGYTGYLVRSVHNGYLAIGLQLGLVGLSIGIAYLFVLFRGSVRLALRAPGPQAVWSLGVITVLILGDLFETRAFVSVGWFLLAITAGYLRPSEVRVAGQDSRTPREMRGLTLRRAKRSSAGRQTFPAKPGRR